MQDDVRICVDARLNMFRQYYTVPPAVQPDLDAFTADLLTMAEASADSSAFEAAFAASDMNQRFTGLLTRCTPKPYQMTQEEKEAVRNTKKQMFAQNKGQIAKDIAADVADSLMMEVESDVIAARRKAMIESGTLDEYTRISNTVEDVGILAKGLGKLFGKKKKK